MIRNKQLKINISLNYNWRYESPNIEVQLSAELTGNLRTLKVSNMLLQHKETTLSSCQSY